MALHSCLCILGQMSCFSTNIIAGFSEIVFVMFHGRRMITIVMGVLASQLNRVVYRLNYFTDSESAIISYNYPYNYRIQT